MIEGHNLSGKQKFSTEWTEAILKDLKGSKPNSLSQFYELAEQVEPAANKIPADIYTKNREIDLVSHFILRLGYCRTEELRRWFVTHETDLFKFRWTILKNNCPMELEIFMAASGLSYQPIDAQEKKLNWDDLVSSVGYELSPVKFEGEKFYKVPWTEAVDLVRVRRVLIKGGMGYIPSKELLFLVMVIFRARLSHNLVLTCRALPALEEDTRLVKLVQNLDKRYII